MTTSKFSKSVAHWLSPKIFATDGSVGLALRLSAAQGLCCLPTMALAFCGEGNLG